MRMWAGWPGRAGTAGETRPRGGGSASTRDERRRFAEIARRTDGPPVPPATGVVPVRLAAAGLLAVGVTGLLTGLARSDGVVLVVVGIVPSAVALLLLALVFSSWLRARGDDRDDPR